MPGDSIYKAGPKDYAKFSLNSFNRPLRSLRELELSMGDFGFLRTHPIVVERTSNGGFSIKEGHHRYEAAKSLGIPFYYVIEKQKFHVARIESSTKGWSIRDCVEAFSKQGLPDYDDLYQYHKQTKISLTVCAQLLGVPNAFRRIREGGFEIAQNRWTLANTVAEIVKALQEANKRVGRNANCARAVINLVHLEQFDPQRMIAKIESRAGQITAKADVSGYLFLLEEIYNHGAGIKFPFAFSAQVAAKERSKNARKSS